MNTRKSLRVILSAVTLITALTCIALAPTLASPQDDIIINPLPQVALPDLTIPTMVAGSSWENVEWIYVLNQGNQTANASTLGVTWYRNRSSRLFTFPVKSLVPGEGVWVQVDLGVYLQAYPGTYMKYKADYFNVLWESNENNNEMDMSN